ncbi:hypothetical protein NHF45_00990 [Maricaulaceae bacterium NA33B04]|nr:hypothetical protein [Maricaulaceae bacterium NA33B04]
MKSASSVFLSSAVAALALALTSTAVAQDVAKPSGSVSLAAELGYAQVADRNGAELGVGGRYAWSGLRLTGMVGGFIYANEDDRFEEQTFNNGNTVCRDLSNGQFADDANCAPDVSAYGKLEAGWAFDNGFEVGVGGRFSEDLTSAYGSVAYRFNGGGAIYAAGGDDYLTVGIGLRY